jgi:hypothetical protein
VCADLEHHAAGLRFRLLVGAYLESKRLLTARPFEDQLVGRREAVWRCAELCDDPSLTALRATDMAAIATIHDMPAEPSAKLV